MSSLNCFSFHIYSNMLKYSNYNGELKDKDTFYMLNVFRKDIQNLNMNKGYFKEKFNDITSFKFSDDTILNINKLGMPKERTIDINIDSSNFNKIVLTNNIQLRKVLIVLIEALLHVPKLEVYVINPINMIALKVTKIDKNTKLSNYINGILLIKYHKNNVKRFVDLIKLCYDKIFSTLETNKDCKWNIKYDFNDEYIEKEDIELFKQYSFDDRNNKRFQRNIISISDKISTNNILINSSNYCLLNCTIKHLFGPNKEEYIPMYYYPMFREIFKNIDKLLYLQSRSEILITYDQCDDEYWLQKKDIRTENQTNVKVSNICPQLNKSKQESKESIIQKQKLIIDILLKELIPNKVQEMKCGEDSLNDDLLNDDSLNDY